MKNPYKLQLFQNQKIIYQQKLNNMLDLEKSPNTTAQ